MRANKIHTVKSPQSSLTLNNAVDTFSPNNEEAIINHGSDVHEHISRLSGESSQEIMREEESAVPKKGKKNHAKRVSKRKVVISAFARVRRFLFSTPSLLALSLLMAANMWSDTSRDSTQFQASLSELSSQIEDSSNTANISEEVTHSDIALIKGVEGSDILEFSLAKPASEVKKISYSLVYDPSKLQAGEPLTAIEGCRIEQDSLQPGLLKIYISCNKSQEFLPKKRIATHTLSRISKEQSTTVVNVVDAEFETKDTAVYRLSGESITY